MRRRDTSQAREALQDSGYNDFAMDHQVHLCAHIFPILAAKGISIDRDPLSTMQGPSIQHRECGFCVRDW